MGNKLQKLRGALGSALTRRLLGSRSLFQKALGVLHEDVYGTSPCKPSPVTAGAHHPTTAHTCCYPSLLPFPGHFLLRLYLQMSFMLNIITPLQTPHTVNEADAQTGAFFPSFPNSADKTGGSKPADDSLRCKSETAAQTMPGAWRVCSHDLGEPRLPPPLLEFGSFVSKKRSGLLKNRH